MFEKALLNHPITHITINTVPIPVYFSLMIYIIFLLSSTILILLFVFFKGYKLLYSIKQAILLSLLISSIAYLVYSEPIWYNWVITDWEAYGGLDTKEKLHKMDYPLYDFALKIKELIPANSNLIIFSSDDYFQIRLEYFLLPFKKKEPPDFIISVVDKESLFDASTGLFKREEKTFTDMEPFFIYAEHAWVLRRK